MLSEAALSLAVLLGTMAAPEPADDRVEQLVDAMTGPIREFSSPSELSGSFSTYGTIRLEFSRIELAMAVIGRLVEARQFEVAYDEASETASFMQETIDSIIAATNSGYALDALVFTAFQQCSAAFSDVATAASNLDAELDSLDPLSQLRVESQTLQAVVAAQLCRFDAHALLALIP